MSHPFLALWLLGSLVMLLLSQFDYGRPTLREYIVALIAGPIAALIVIVSIPILVAAAIEDIWDYFVRVVRGDNDDR